MLTPQATLRDWILSVLSETPDGSAKRAEVLASIERRFGSRFTEKDLESPTSRPFEANWRNRASFERAQLIREGLLSARADGVWELKNVG